METKPQRQHIDQKIKDCFNHVYLASIVKVDQDYQGLCGRKLRPGNVGRTAGLGAAELRLAALQFGLGLEAQQTKPQKPVTSLIIYYLCIFDMSDDMSDIVRYHCVCDGRPV